MTYTVRMLGPKVAYVANINGRTYSGAPGGVYDIQDGDAATLAANGWVRVAISGPTTARPSTSQAQAPGGYSAQQNALFFDTTLDELIVYDGATWRSPATGASV
jgi:hypothetical protein